MVIFEIIVSYDIWNRFHSIKVPSLDRYFVLCVYFMGGNGDLKLSKIIGLAFLGVIF